MILPSMIFLIEKVAQAFFTPLDGKTTRKESLLCGRGKQLGIYNNFLRNGKRDVHM